MKDNYIVYIHISPSNKRYIGITGQIPEKRWNNGNGYRKNTHFWRAINKYGWENFQHIIIAKGLTKEVAYWLEIELIKIWDTTNPNKGYNISLGGDGCNGCKMSEERKKEQSERIKGENHHMYGKHHSEETKEKISKSLIGKMTKEKHPMYNVHRYGEKAPNYGNHHSEETKEKMRKSMEDRGGVKGGKNPNAKKVICLETMQIFDTIKDASNFVNGNPKKLSAFMKKGEKYKGYTFMLYKDYIENI